MKKFQSTVVCPSIVLCLITFSAGSGYCQSLIPVSSQKALTTWRSLCQLMDYSPKRPLTPENIGVELDSKYPLYLFSDDVASFEFNACSDEAIVSIVNMPQMMSEAEVKVASVKWLGEAQITKIAEEIKQKVLPASILYRTDMMEGFGRISSQQNGARVEKIPNANIAKVFFREKMGKVFGLSTLLVSIDKSTGKIQSVGLSLAKDKACDLLPNQGNNSRELESIKTWDEWLLCYEALLSKDRRSLLSSTTSPPRRKNPVRLFLNTEMCGDELLYPPRLIDGKVLIYQGYFPSFEINVEQKVNTLTLTGLLPKKGAKVVVAVSSKEALIGNKPITLSSAPQEIEGRLYLPYELLSLCNGVLTRWEPKKNTLYVDTRFLRRDE